MSAFPKKKGKWDDYEIHEKIGEGTYGHVYKAKHKATKSWVALKQLLNFPEEEDGIPFTSIREIKFLKRLKGYPNVINLLDTFFSEDGKLCLVFDWMEHDLSALLSSLPSPLSLKHVKCYMFQILKGLNEIHSSNLMHRDIKAANMLLNNAGQLNIADFGLMTSTTREIFSNNVITRWFKPPEILLGSVKYGPEVDMWGVGCVLIEMLTGKTPFPGNDDKHQLKLVLSRCGTEALYEAKKTPDTPKNLSKLPKYSETLQEFSRVTKSRMRSDYSSFQPEVLSLLEELLCVDPHKRITAGDALDHDFFWSGVPQADMKDMPNFKFSIHEYELKQKRKQRGGQRDPMDHLPAPTRPGGTSSIITNNININTNITNININTHNNTVPPAKIRGQGEEEVG
eukprot:CAMPEP_0201510182 /NCGR_PEP_ID=MMETSP0161_2-20130828/2983_1 /ASSEMBLY_ACC=CAM_ASM_000251 /TAXON_ID=180227 /ORGANISM="Neoparamoeba aestuarina, Strain SoJaBio B1-5/56/2" /LENGTH=396 /DNA_ID=CAMNT_0047905323 /DNA_START=227 /DNA_END=1414 /DNA_ORIENTATION=-